MIVVFFSPVIWKRIEKYSRYDYIVLFIGIILTVGFLTYINLKSYPADYAGGKLIVDSSKMVKDGFKDAGRFFGLVAGWFVERHFVRFTTDVPVHRRVLRCLTGSMLLIIFEKVLTPAVAVQIGSDWSYFVMMALCLKIPQLSTL